MAAIVEFDTTVTAMGNNTGVVVPSEMVAALGAGQRPAVLVNVNGYEYRNTVGVMAGRHMISISSAVRRETGLTGGDSVHVILTVAEGPRQVSLPEDFAAALQVGPSMKPFFDALSNSIQRFHIDNIEAAKTPETRARRIEKSVELFRQGKMR